MIIYDVMAGERSQYGVYKRRFLIRSVHIHAEYDFINDWKHLNAITQCHHNFPSSFVKIPDVP